MEKSRMYDMIGYENEDDYHIHLDGLYDINEENRVFRIYLSKSLAV